jgi:hypothetical protein
VCFVLEDSNLSVAEACSVCAALLQSSTILGARSLFDPSVFKVGGDKRRAFPFLLPDVTFIQGNAAFGMVDVVVTPLIP